MKNMKILRQLRLMAVRIALVLTMIAAAVAYLLDPLYAHGLLLGGIAGVLVFWITARQLEKLAGRAAGGVYSLPTWWSVVRFAVYGLVLARAYMLDRESLGGLWSALAGLFIIRLVLVFLGFTGLDLKQEGG